MTRDALISWSRPMLRGAGIYNLLWGTWVALFPNHFFELAGIPVPYYPEIWQGVGMIVGVFGVGYWIAADDYRRFYPVVLVGFLGKLFGSVGIAFTIVAEDFPAAFMIITIPNDVIWLLPFGILLADAIKWERAEK